MKTTELNGKKYTLNEQKDGSIVLKPETTEPWEPELNAVVLWPNGSVGTTRYQKDNSKTGRSFATHEAAKKASKWFTFYQRLYKLAEEMNAKHENDSYTDICRVYWSSCKKQWKRTASLNVTSNIDAIFTSLEAAQEAANIMNRDGWTIPTELP